MSKESPHTALSPIGAEPPTGVRSAKKKLLWLFAGCLLVVIAIGTLLSKVFCSAGRHRRDFIASMKMIFANIFPSAAKQEDE